MTQKKSLSGLQNTYDGAADKMRLLIVEDNVDSALIMGRLMTVLAAVEVEITNDGPSALSKFPQFRPHIVVLDIGLPGMDGYRVAREMRARADFEGTLLVAVTGYGREEDRRQAAEAGFDLHLLKPAGVEDFQALLTHPKVLARLQAERSVLRDTDA